MTKKNGREAKKTKAKKTRDGYGHAKGSSFEREICKELSLWWSKGVRDDIFWRTAGSGARATVRRKGRDCDTANSTGDMCSLHSSGEPFIRHFLIEMKKGYTRGGDRIDVLKMIDALEGRKSCLLQQWLDKAWLEAHSAGRKEVWLIFQRDLSKPMLMVRHSWLAELQDGMSMSFPYPNIQVGSVEENWSIVGLRDFLNWFKPEQVIPPGKLKRRSLWLSK